MRFQVQLASPSSAVRLGKLLVSQSGQEMAMDTPGCFLYSRYDPADQATVCASDRVSVPVWATGGRLQVNIDDYADCATISRPTAFQAPTDNETALPVCKQAGRKRCGNSVIRTGKYLEMLLEKQKQDMELSKIPVLVSLAGGNDREWRLSGIKQTEFSIASGIVLDGFYHPVVESKNAPESEQNGSDLPKEHLFNLLPAICDKLPVHLPRILPGVWQPCDIAMATNLGVDLFDGSLPYRLTRSAMAWIYPGWSDDDTPKSEHPCQLKFLTFPLDEVNGEHAEVTYNTPLQSGCKCFACQRHTQGYISHMHVAKEMLGPMLLMIHNSTQYYRFFNDLRRAASTNRLDEFITFTEALSFPLDLLALDKTFESKTANDECCYSKN